jgi:hypothetical protein
MNQCGDFLGILQALVNNPFNPMSAVAVWVNPLYFLAAVLLAAYYAVAGCFP